MFPKKRCFVFIGSAAGDISSLNSDLFKGQSSIRRGFLGTCGGGVMAGRQRKGVKIRKNEK